MGPKTITAESLRDVPVTKHPGHPMRRSTRIERQIPVLITSLDPRRSVCEECHTVALNAHGCGVRLRERIPPGTPVFLDLLTEQRLAKGVVIDSVPLDTSGTDWLIGIELETFGNFWGLSDAPPDWSTEPGGRVLAKPEQRAQTEPAAVPPPSSALPVRLTDLSPFACYVESDTTLSRGSALEIDFRTDQIRVHCCAVVRLEHPNAGMGLEFIPSDSHNETALHLLIQMLIASGEAAGLKSTVHFPQNIDGGSQQAPQRGDSPIQDPLLSLILKPDSVDVQAFLEDLGRQRLS